MKERWLIACLSGVALFSSAPARADGKSACFDAASQAQVMRDEHRLVEARAQLRVCSSAACPAAVQKDCASWLDGVEQGLPTVVVSAKDGCGKDLVDVALSIDGQPVASKLTGQAIPVNPGLRAFHLALPDGTSVDRQVMVREGKKNESVDVVIGAQVAPPTTPPATPSSERSSSASWRTVGWVTGGVGVAGLALGSIFGGLAISDKSAAQCNASGRCQPGPLSDARSAATVSTIGLAAGGVLAAGGLALVLFAPRGSHRETASVALSPLLGPGQAGVSVGGGFQ